MDQKLSLALDALTALEAGTYKREDHMKKRAHSKWKPRIRPMSYGVHVVSPNKGWRVLDNDGHNHCFTDKTVDRAENYARACYFAMLVNSEYNELVFGDGTYERDY